MTTFAPALLPQPTPLRPYTVAHIMTPDPLAFEKRMPIQKASALLQFNQLDAAPVVDEARRLAGIVTVASCTAWEEFSLRSAPSGFVPKELDTTPVGEIASPAVECVRENASAEEAMDRFAERRVRRIYVVNKDEELVGVVSVADLIRHLSERAALSQAPNFGAAQCC